MDLVDSMQKLTDLMRDGRQNSGIVVAFMTLKIHLILIDDGSYRKKRNMEIHR
jgi:hypothetical protein